jgi:copper oxidase (laccase) domain-containing protein
MKLTYGTVEVFSLGKSDLFGKDEASLPGNANSGFPKTPLGWKDFTENAVSNLFPDPKYSIYCLDQIHSEAIITTNDLEKPKPGFGESEASFPQGDGLISMRPNEILAIRTADCVPVAIWSERFPVLGLIHAGWKGAKLGIIPRFFQMIREGGLDLSELGYYIGPALLQEDFEVEWDVGSQFPKKYLNPGKKEGKFHLDLCAFLKDQILYFSPRAKGIIRSENTKGSKEWFSHRSGDLGRNITGILYRQN